MERKIRAIQLTLIFTAAAAFWLAIGWQAAVAALYGSAVVLANGVLQRRQQNRAAQVAGLSPERNLRYLYRCAVERFIATVLMFAIGIGLLKMHPMPLLGGFIIAQVAVVYRFYQESSLRRRHG